MPTDTTKKSNKPELDAEGQRVMAEGMGQAPAQSNDGLMSEEEAIAAYRKIYNSEPSEDNQLPNRSHSYHMNGMDRDNPEPVKEVEAAPPEYNPDFTEEEKTFLQNLGSGVTQEAVEDLPPQPAPEDNSEVATLKAEIQELKKILLEANKPDDASAHPAELSQPVQPEQTAEDSADQDMATLDAILQKRFGIDFQSVYKQFEFSNQVVDYMRNVEAAQKVETMKDDLKEKWGDNYDFRFEKAKELYETLPDTDKQNIDNMGIRGAELLWAKVSESIESEPEVPNFDRGKTSMPRASDPKDIGVVSKDYLLSLSNEEYAREMRPGGKLWNAAIQGKINYGNI